MGARQDYPVHPWASEHVHRMYKAMCDEIDSLRAEVSSLKTVSPKSLTDTETAVEYDDGACRVPGAAAKGICAYAAHDGTDACGERCIWKGDQ